MSTPEDNEKHSNLESRVKTGWAKLASWASKWLSERPSGESDPFTRLRSGVLLGLGVLVLYGVLIFLPFFFASLVLGGLGVLLGREYFQLMVHHDPRQHPKDPWVFGLICGFGGWIAALVSHAPATRNFLFQPLLLLAMVSWFVAIGALLGEKHLLHLSKKPWTRYIHGLLTIVTFLASAAWLFPENFPFAILLSVAADTLGYAVGRRFGRHFIAPDISPKKTLEGFGGSILGCIIVVGLWLFVKGGSNVSVFQSIVLGVIFAFAALFGDLLESKLKREAGVKDSGNLIPGHGGLYDRLDSHLLVVPLFALCLLLFR